MLAKTWRLPPGWKATHHLFHSAAGHLLHQLFHLSVLFQETVDVLDLEPAAEGNAPFARPIDRLREAPLGRSHRVDDRDLAPELLFVGAVPEGRRIDVACNRQLVEER